MSTKRTVAQRRLAARAIVAKKSGVGGFGAYRTKSAGAPAKRAVLRKPIVRGKGAYKKDYGARLGAVIGEGVQEALTQLLPAARAFTGFGDYAPAAFAKGIKSNSLLSMGLDPPEIRNSGQMNVIVRHREYLCDVITGSAGTFTLNTFAINPGQPDTFPWLSQIASAFEQYKLRGVIFEFKSTSADSLSSTNTALGTVIMSTEYDATKPSFTTKVAMENHQYSSSARQSSSMLHPIECAHPANVLTELYVRSGDATDTDLRFTDFGNFQIATVGQQGSSVNIGELWVSYEIELLKPRMPSASGSTEGYTGHVRTLSGVAAATPFGAQSPSQLFGNLGLGFVNATTLQLPKWVAAGQQFLCVFAAYGSSAATSAVTVTLSSGLTVVSQWNGNSQTGANSGGTTTTLISCFAFLVNSSSANGETIQISGGAYPTGTVSSDFWITSMVPGVTLPAMGDKEYHREAAELLEKMKQLEQRWKASAIEQQCPTPTAQPVPLLTASSTTEEKVQALRLLLDKKK